METIELASADEVTVFTDAEHIVPDKIDFEFEQSSKTRGIYRQITIFNGNHCYQSIKNKHRRKYKYRVDIAYLNPHPYREHHIAWKWLYIAAALLVTSAALVGIGWFTDFLGPNGPDTYYGIAVVISITATLIAFLLFGHNSYDKVIFKSQHSDIKLIELINKFPSKAEFRKFIGRFIVQIRKAKAEKKLTVSKFLVDELKELRRLRDETVITDEEYQSAKVIIFKHKSFTSG